MKTFFVAIVILIGGPSQMLSQNVGIGTATPEGLLHVKGTNWTKAILENNAGEPRGYIGADNNGTITLGSNAYWNGSAWVYPNNGSSMYLLLHRPNNRYEFRVRPEGGSQATAMTIDTGSNVTVGGNLVIDQENGNTGTISNTLRFGNFSGEGIGSKRNSGTGQYGLDFYTNSTNRMTITNAGFIGIGLNTPKSLLTIKHGGIVYDETPPDGKHAIAIWDSSYNLSSVAMLMGTQNTNGVGYIGVERIGTNGVPPPKLVLNVHGAPVIIGGTPPNSAIQEKLVVKGRALVEGNLQTDMNLNVGEALTVQNGAAITGQLAVTGNISGTGNAQLGGTLMVAGNRGIIRNSGTEQLKYVTTNTQITRLSILPNTFTEHNVYWSENFNANPVTAYLADIPGGFGFEMLSLKVKNVTSTGCIVVVSNSTNTPIPCDFTLKIVAIGPQ